MTNEFTCRFVPVEGKGTRPLLLLSGTGGDESDLLQLGHIQVRDLMKLPGRVRRGQPGTATGGKRR